MRNRSDRWVAARGCAGSAGRTIMPSSSIQNPLGTLTTPNSSSRRCAGSISDGCVGVGRLDERARGVGAVDVEGDGDDLEALRVKLSAQCLPHGQVEAAASPGGPRDEQHLLAAQATRAGTDCREHVRAAQVGCHAVVSTRPVTADSGPSAHRPWRRRAPAACRAVRQRSRHRRAPPCTLGQRNADLALARALGLDLPTGARLEGGDGRA